MRAAAPGVGRARRQDLAVKAVNGKANATTEGFDLANDDIGENVRLALWRTLLEVRLVELRAHDLFLQNLVKGTSHLALGHEAVAAGFGVAMRLDDWTFCTYRGHHHTLARGVPMEGVLGELMGRECGVLGGKGGSMHLTSIAHGAMGSYAIVGAHLPIATGAAWSAKHRGSGQVAVCFFGDGATNIGAFHEALNLAAVWTLPVVFVCENNLYMEYTSIGEVTAVEHPAAGRARSYGLEPVIVDGNDADAVFRIARGALEHARNGGGPTLIECKTYRHGGHSRADPATYRPEAEVAAWLARDPVPAYRARLADFGFKEKVIAALEAETQRAVDAATETAKASPPPSSAVLEAHVWADGGSSWRN